VTVRSEAWSRSSHLLAGPKALTAIHSASRQARTACVAQVVRVLVASDLGVLFGGPGSQVLDGGEQGGAGGMRMQRRPGAPNRCSLDDGINRVKPHRPMATRYSQLAVQYEATIQITAINEWLHAVRVA
jgi:hypothetical protein